YRIVIYFLLSYHNSLFIYISLYYLFLFCLSLLAMLIAVYLIYRRRNYGTAFVMIMLQYGFAFCGYGISKLPYIVYPYIDISTSIVNENMAFALTIVFALGLLLLIPSIVLVARLFLFDKDDVKGNKKY